MFADNFPFRRFKGVLRGEGQFAVIDPGRFEETFVFNHSFVAPEIVAIDVAESEPKAGVKGIMIGGVSARDGRKIARDLDSARRAHMSEKRAQHMGIFPDIMGDWFASARDD